MKRTVLMIFAAVAVFFCLPSCETTSERKPVGPEVKSSTSQQPWNQMQKFEENPMFGPMNRRR